MSNIEESGVTLVNSIIKKLYVNLFPKFIIILVLFFVLIPNLRPIFKYVGQFNILILMLYLLLYFVLYLFFKKYVTKKESKLLNLLVSYKTITLLFFILIVTVSSIYQVADGLKTDMRGSDQDDCVIIVTNQILNFEYPYSERSYFDNPCSTGIGMIVIQFPFVTLNIYPIGAIFYLILLYLLLISHYKTKISGMVFLVLLLSSVFVMEMFVVGSDLIVVGLGIVILLLMLIKFDNSQKLLRILAYIWAGLISSTRINFIIIIPILSLFLYKKNKIEAKTFFLISFITSTLPSFLIFLLNPKEFTPLHLVGKADNLLSSFTIAIVVISTILGLVIGIKIIGESFKKINLAFFISFAPHLIALSLSDLQNRNFNISSWEGANYLVPIIPLMIWCLMDSSLLSTSINQQY